MAQEVEGSDEAKTVPPVTFSPRIILSFTGFQILLLAGASKAWPYFQDFSSIRPELTPPGSGRSIAPDSLPAGAASGNCVVPGAALLAYGDRKSTRLNSSHIPFYSFP